MAFLIKNGVIINDERELVGVGTAGITTALYVGESISADALSGIITAISYAGSGANLTDIDARVIVSDGIPTGISTVEGDLYYDSTDLTLFTYYDNNWVDAAPVPPSATKLSITNSSGVNTVVIDLPTEILKIEGTALQTEVTTNPAGNSITVGLLDDVAIGGSMTANEFYGDGSGLTNLDINAAQYVDLLGLQAGIITATGQLIVSGAGVGLTVTNDALIEGTLQALNINATNILKANTIEAFVGTAVSFADDVIPFTDNTYDLGLPGSSWKDISFTGNLSGNTTGVATGFASVGAEFFYGDGSNLSGVLATDGGGDASLDGHLAVVSLEATGAGIALTVTNDVSVGGSVTAGSFVGPLAGDVAAAIVSASSSVTSPNFFGGALELTGNGSFGGNLEVDGSFGFVGDVTTVVAISTDISGANTNTELVTALAVEEALGAFNTGSATTVTSFDDQTNSDFPMPFLSAAGIGVSIFTDSTTLEEFTYNPATGTLKAKEFDSLSDARLKTQIVSIEGAMNKVASLRGVEYDWVNGSGSSVGVLAQEVQEVYPQLVSDSGERLTVNYNGLVGLLIAAVNEMGAEIAELKAQK